MSSLRVLSNGVMWQPWSGAAFARARDERKPVLLALATAWCGSCHEMDRTSYADPDIIALINDRFVAVRVDADDRPDISERYSLGGWPTTAFLTPAGEILTGGTFVPPDRLRAILLRVAEAYSSQPDRKTEADHHPLTGDTGTPVSDHDLTTRIFAGFDQHHAGFGGEPRFPFPSPIRLALELFIESQDASFERIVVSSLDRWAGAVFTTSVDGGFFRYASTRDWRQPHVEKLLERERRADPAVPRRRRTAPDRAVYGAGGRCASLHPDLAGRSGRWRMVRIAAGRRGYYAAETPRPGDRCRAPPVATVALCRLNAAMVSTALTAARVFNDDGLRDFAVKSLERVLLRVTGRAAALRTGYDGQPKTRGLLADQFAMADACLDVFDLTGNVVYEMMAEELAHYAVRMMWDDQNGGFFDRVTRRRIAIGLLRQPLKPFVANCDASRTPAASGRGLRRSEFAAVAGAPGRPWQPLAPDQGPLAAHYVLALRAVTAR